jgi:putative surface cell wall-binding protein
MRQLLRVIRRIVGPVVGACALLAAGMGGFVVVGAGSADAAACPGTPVAAGTTCTDTGTLNFTAGVLNLTVPTALTWAGTGNGLNQYLVDATTAHQAYIVDDATGSGAGWNVTVSATTFTSTSPAATLPNTGAFATNGALTLTAGALSTTAPTASCTVGVSGNTCTLPTDSSVTYPVIMNTAATTPTVYKIYDALAATGLGSITIGLPGAAPVGWWVTVPANTVPSTAYTSTITLEVITAP